MKRHFGAAAAVACALAAAAPAAALAHDGGGDQLRPGNLLVSGSTYREADIQPGVTQLPPGCTAANCVTATADGAYPYVFNNDAADGSFGVTSPILLWQLTPSGDVVGKIKVPTDQLVTSFSSKSELGAERLHHRTRGDLHRLRRAAARARRVQLQHPGRGGPDQPGARRRLPRGGSRSTSGANFSFTETNAYSGNNGRAAILNDEPGADVFYTAGNAGNGANPQPAGIVEGAGAQIFSPSFKPEWAQNPGAPTPVGSFSVTQLGDKADKIGKDDNFRGMTVFNNVLYYTKGSGSNGVNTVYFVDTTGKACPNGTGVPAAGAKLPTTSIPYDPQHGGETTGLTSNMCILSGFNTALAKNATDASSYPFGIWFANSHTLYVADEGAGDNTFDTTSGTYSAAAASTTAGLQKWVLKNTSTGPTWNLAYTLQGGLNLGQPYTSRGIRSVTTPSPAAVGAGHRRPAQHHRARQPRRPVTVWAVTSTVCGSGDQGADPNQLVAITDNPSAATPAAGESFHTVMAPTYGQVVRGVSMTPGGGDDHHGDVRMGRDRAHGRARRSAH